MLLSLAGCSRFDLVSCVCVVDVCVWLCGCFCAQCASCCWSEDGIQMGLVRMIFGYKSLVCSRQAGHVVVTCGVGFGCYPRQ